MSRVCRSFERAISLGVLVASCAAPACTATVGSDAPRPSGAAAGASGGASGTGGTAASAAAGGAIGSAGTTGSALGGTRSRFIRLTHQEWENTARDILRLEAAPGLSSNFTADPPNGRFDTDQRRRVVTPPLIEDYRRAAEKLAGDLVSNGEARATLGATTDALSSAAGVETWLQNWLLRAYRRPATPDERARYAQLYAQGPALFPDEAPDVAGLQLVVTATLQSPHFLYLVEQSAAGGRVNDYELASRLAFALTASPPSSELLTAAAQGKLSDSQQLASTVASLLSTAQGASVLQSFHRQLLRMQEYAFVQGDPAHPEDATRVAQQLLRDGLAFVNHAVAEKDGGLRALLTGPQLFAGAATAPLYGAAAVVGDTPQALEPLPDRRGFLTTAGFLATYAHGLTPDPIHRGLFINLQILCRDLPPPPANVPPVPPEAPGTNRQRIERHTGPGTCGAGCHSSIINPPGFAFENYDGLGRYRTSEAAGPIDASGSVDLGSGAVTFQNGIELAELLAESPLAHACYARRWSEYLLARDVNEADPALMQTLTTASLTNDASARALVAAVAQSGLFTQRDEVKP
jgi:hypothetical protein